MSGATDFGKNKYYKDLYSMGLYKKATLSKDR